ncbi:DUF1622 domain-containing protein [Chloroflexota bacterium]
MNLAPILSEGTEPILQWFVWIYVFIEALAVTWILIGVSSSTVRYIYRVVKNSPPHLVRYTEYRHTLARTLMLGLEILVAADIVRTVALESTLANVGVLGLLVLIRIALGWSLVVEIEGHWPWQPKRD